MRYLSVDAAGHIQAVITYSTPPVGYHAALAWERLYEAETAGGGLPILRQLMEEARALEGQEADFLAAWAREGLVLVEIPPTEEDLSDLYEEVVPGKPERGVRVRSAFEAKARAWPRVDQQRGGGS